MYLLVVDSGFRRSCNIEESGLENRVLLVLKNWNVVRPRDFAENISWLIPDPRIPASGFTAHSAEKLDG